MKKDGKAKRRAKETTTVPAVDPRRVFDFKAIRPIEGAYTEVPSTNRVRGAEPAKVLSPRGLAVVEALAAAGTPQCLIARRCGLDAKTLRAAFRRQPDASEAYARGLAA